MLLGKSNYEVIKNSVEDIILVSDEEIKRLVNATSFIFLILVHLIFSKYCFDILTCYNRCIHAIAL